MNWIYIILGIGIIGSAILFLESARERKHFVMTHYKITLPPGLNVSEEFKGKDGDAVTATSQNHTGKVMILSDLHNKEYGVGNIQLIEAIRDEQPDMIWIAGDMLIGKEDTSTVAVVSLMTELIRIAPIYYGNGNHEQRMKENTDKYGSIYAEYKHELVKAGVIFLENETTEVELAGRKIHVSGLEIPFNYYERGLYDALTPEDITACIGEKKQGYQVLLAHNPVHCEGYGKWGADLVVSGHLHGGIIRGPFLGGMITPQVRFFPKYSGGFYTLNRMKIIVSKGLGEHTVNIRFMNRPEVIVLHVNE